MKNDIKDHKRVGGWRTLSVLYYIFKGTISSSNFDRIENFACLISSFEAPSRDLLFASLVPILLIELFDILQGIHVLGDASSDLLQSSREMLRCERPLVGVLVRVLACVCLC